MVLGMSYRGPDAQSDLERVSVYLIKIRSHSIDSIKRVSSVRFGKGVHSGLDVDVLGFVFLAVVLAGDDDGVDDDVVAVVALVVVGVAAAVVVDVVVSTVVAVVVVAVAAVEVIFLALASKYLISRKFSPALPVARLSSFPVLPVCVQSCCRGLGGEPAAAAAAAAVVFVVLVGC